MLTVSPGSTGPSASTATGTSASTPASAAAAAAAPRLGAVNHDIQVQPGRWVDSTSAPLPAVHGVPDAWSSSSAATATAAATTLTRPVQSHFGPPQAALMVPAVEPAVPASAFAGFLSQLRSQANASPPVPQHVMLSGAAPSTAVPAARPAVDLPYGSVVPASAGVNGVPMMAHWSHHQQQHQQQQQPSWEANAAWGDRGIPGVFNQPSWPLQAAPTPAVGPHLQSRQQPFTNSVMHQQPSSDMSHHAAPHLLQSYQDSHVRVQQQHQQHQQHRLQPGGWPGVATSSANAGQDIEVDGCMCMRVCTYAIH